MTRIVDLEIEEFRRDGATVLRQLLPESWVDELAAGVEHNRTHPSEWSHWYTNPDESDGFWSDYVTWRSVPEYERIVREGSLAMVASQLMGSRTARFFHEHVLVKEPGATERTPWHHDQPYYCVDGDQSVSMWIALDPVPADTAMRFLAGSHRWDRWFIPRKFVDHTPYAAESGRYELLPDIDALIAEDPDRRRVVSFDTDPGDVIVFHYRTLHDAPGNPSTTTRRRAVSLRWVGDDAVWAERPWQVSPPFDPAGLVPGDALDDERFPVVHPGS
ncbi:MAG: phytanoyl-CoA dioxygenase family protein [Ilumatobacter sp.]|uniref:phytanoyl-CoA dioxygenase family protein n=1 Tax=Ilumatobacter sp. TaxID=1967498 RepID=UPI002632A945|nr:phytanoyl-CoA dioxygenase family protein [Ilumatobacter sp.]MDJ0768879.1 phytanoyl-CoA dioxygenase family protein [Ilumatobacter sp.]